MPIDFTTLTLTNGWLHYLIIQATRLFVGSLWLSAVYVLVAVREARKPRKA